MSVPTVPNRALTVPNVGRAQCCVSVPSPSIEGTQHTAPCSTPETATSVPVGHTHGDQVEGER